MKEQYFSPASIQDKAAEMAQSLAVLRSRHENMRLDPLRTALLVLDMQEYFLDPGSHAFIPSATAILPGVQKLIAAYSAGSRLVVFTRHINDDRNAGMMSAWWQDLIREESALSKISAELDTTAGKTLSKTQYDAFYQTDLKNILRGEGVEQVVITGVMTHLCCETTARSAFMRGFEVFFAIDGTATYTEAFHQATLLNLAHGFALPVQVTEILAAYGSV
ncbi:MAG: isochorismatase family protein [Chloroflexota bacterium]